MSADRPMFHPDGRPTWRQRLADLVLCPACLALRIGPGHRLRRLAGVCPNRHGRGGMSW